VSTVEPAAGAVQAEAIAPNAHVLYDQLDAVWQTDGAKGAVEPQRRCDEAECEAVEVDNALAGQVKLDHLARPDRLLARFGVKPNGRRREVCEPGGQLADHFDVRVSDVGFDGT
jgi:hypothetical protein